MTTTAPPDHVPGDPGGILHRIGLLLAAELELERLVQRITDEATAACGARYGAFFYDAADDHSGGFSLFTLSGADRADFARLGAPRITDVFGPTFEGRGVVRSEDVTADPRYGRDGALEPLPFGHLPVRSYLAAPVISRGGRVLGLLSFGHPEPGRFGAAHECTIEGIANQAAVGIDNARLYDQIRRERDRASEREQEQRFLAESIPQQVWTADPGGSIDYVNARVVEYFGMPADAIFRGGWREVLHPDDMEPASRAWAHSLATGEPYEVEYRLRDAAGGYRWHIGRARARRDAEGRVLRWFGTNTDIHEQRSLVDALRQSEHRYAQILDSVQDMVFVKAPGSVITYANAATCQYYGMTTEELRRQSEAPRDPTAEVPKYLLDDQRVFETGETIAVIEEPNAVRSGEVRHFHTIKTPILDTNGRVVQLVGVSRDITERKRDRDRMKALTEISRVLATSLEHGPELACVPALVVPTAAAGCTLEVRHERSSAGEHVPLASIARERGELTVAADAVAAPIRCGGVVVGAIGFVWRDRAVGENECGFVEEVAWRLGIWVENASLYQDFRGVLAERDAVVRRAETERERLFRVLMEAPPMFAFSMGREHRFEFANSAYLQIAGREVVGRTCREVWPELEGQPFFDLLDRVYASGEAHVGRETPAVLRDADGIERTRYFDFVYQPTRDPDGCVEGILTCAVEVTEQVLARQAVEQMNASLEGRVAERTSQLQESNRELEAFTYTVSHDLRGPIRHVSGFVDLLRRHAADRLDDKSRRYLDVIGESAQRMGLLIDGLLAFSRMARTEVAQVDVDLAETLADVVRDSAIDTSGREVVWEIGHLPVVRGDPTMLRAILTNLIGNALKYTSRQATASIRVGAIDGEADQHVIFVADDGVGFDPKYLHKLFGVFQRLHGDDEFPGTGIGLASVRRMVQRHGGRVWAEGSPGRGATFYFTLPRSR